MSTVIIRIILKISGMDKNKANKIINVIIAILSAIAGAIGGATIA